MVSVNPGGEPERDDTGLPPVDIEIPDDARELDRDVQAYYRELRAERRRQRGRRLGWPRLAKDGIILPLLACCMILALITGTLLTVFTATSDHDVPALPHNTPGTGSAARNHPSGPASTRPGTARPPHSRPGGPASPSTGKSAPSATPRASGTGSPAPDVSAADDSAGLLPDIALPLVGIPGMAPLPLADLSASMLVLFPAHCSCSASVRWLTAVAARARAPVYFVATPATRNEVLSLDSGLSTWLQSNVVVMMDTLGQVQARYPADGLTALIIATPHSVYYVPSPSTSSSATTIRADLAA